MQSLQKFRKIFSIIFKFPYKGFGGKILFLDYLFLKLYSLSSFPRMSLLKYCKTYFDLSTDEEFRVLYYVSRIGFNEKWDAKARNSKEEIENFYLEHDSTLRHTYLSRYDYNYKKKMLSIYHIIKTLVNSYDDPILDYGCGAGVLVNYLAEKGYKKVDAADIESGTLNFVKSQMSDKLNRIFVTNAIDSFKLDNDYYQAISIISVLEHTHNPILIINKLMLALRKHGYLIIEFPRENDFTGPHIKQAQEQRDEVFNIIKKQCVEVLPEYVYQKIK